MILLAPLFLIPAALCLALFVLRPVDGEGDDWRRVLSAPVLAFLRPEGALRARSFALLALAIVLAALASPALRAESADSHALDEGVLVLVDVSKSMELTDIRPDRMAAARAAILAISNEAAARPLALIAYAGDAFLIEPFAVDARQFNAFAAALEVGLVKPDGSNLERALALATSVISDSRVGKARLVLVSDGGGFSNATAVIAARLANDGHRLDVVAIADPATENPVTADFRLMGETAVAGHGVFASAGADGLVDLSPIRLRAGLFDAGALTTLSLRSTDWRNLSHYILLLALPALLLAFRQARR